MMIWRTASLKDKTVLSLLALISVVVVHSSSKKQQSYNYSYYYCTKYLNNKKVLAMTRIQLLTAPEQLGGGDPGQPDESALDESQTKLHQR